MMYMVPDLVGGRFERQETTCRNIFVHEHQCFIIDVIGLGVFGGCVNIASFTE
jgi:hypothetical protein